MICSPYSLGSPDDIITCSTKRRQMNLYNFPVYRLIDIIVHISRAQRSCGRRDNIEY